MRAGRILRKRGMSHSLMLNQHRILVSKKLGDILCVLQRSDGVDLSIEQLISYCRARNSDERGIDRVSNNQDTITQSLALESRQGFDGTNRPFGNHWSDIDRPCQQTHREQEKNMSRTSPPTWHRLESPVNQKVPNSDKDQGHTSGGTISRRRDNVVKYLLQRNTIRHSTIRSSNSLNGVGSRRKARRIDRERPDRVLRETVRVGEAIGTAGFQYRDDGGVGQLVRSRRPICGEVESTEKRN